MKNTERQNNLFKKFMDKERELKLKEIKFEKQKNFSKHKMYKYQPIDLMND